MHTFGLEFTEDQVLALFGYYDGNRDGSLSYYEFVEKVLESGFSLEGDKKKDPIMVSLFQTNQHPKEAEMKTQLTAEDMDEVKCKEVFKRYDANNSGEMDVRELQQLVWSLGLQMDREAINNAMLDLDKNRNGTISFDEFWAWWHGLFKNGATQKAGPRSGVRRGSRSGVLDDLKDALLTAKNAKVQGGGRPQSSGQGAWSSQGGTGILAPLSANPGILARPQTRNGQRSVAGEDYSSPVGYVKPPILHGLRSHTATGFRERPQTAPVGDNAGKIPANSGWFLEHTRVPGEAIVPGGKRTTGYCL